MLFTPSQINRSRRIICTMGCSLAKNKAPGLQITASLKILVVGRKKCGKTTIIRRYITNQFLASNKETQENEPQKTSRSPQLAQLSTHTLKVPGRNEVVSVTFWEIPSSPLTYMKKQYYTGADAVLIVVDGEIGQSNNEGIDPEEMMREAQAWKKDIVDNYRGSSTPTCDIPMIIFVNKKDSEATAHITSGQEHSDLRQQGGITIKEQLIDLATSSGFSSCLEVHPHTGDESVLRAVDSLLRLLMEKKNIDQRLTTDLPYPTLTWNCHV